MAGPPRIGNPLVDTHVAPPIRTLLPCATGTRRTCRVTGVIGWPGRLCFGVGGFPVPGSPLTVTAEGFRGETAHSGLRTMWAKRKTDRTPQRRSPANASTTVLADSPVAPRPPGVADSFPGAFLDFGSHRRSATVICFQRRSSLTGGAAVSRRTTSAGSRTSSATMAGTVPRRRDSLRRTPPAAQRHL